MNEIDLAVYNLAYAQFRGIGIPSQRIRSMRRPYADLSAADHEQEYYDSVSPGRYKVTEQRSPRPSILRCLLKAVRGGVGPLPPSRTSFTPYTGAPPTPDSLPTQTGAPVCLFGSGGDFTTEWPKIREDK